jgi:septum formation protein
LGKPSDRDEANSFLSLLSGRRHKVITCVTVRKQNKIRTKEVVSRVKMRTLDFQEKEFYLDSGDWEGKAGGYGIQGIASSFIPWIGGSYTGIVGLPLTETIGLLRTFGYPVFSEKNG